MKEIILHALDTPRSILEKEICEGAGNAGVYDKKHFLIFSRDGGSFAHKMGVHPFGKHPNEPIKCIGKVRW